MTTTAYTIKQFGVLSIGKFFAVFGLVWGFFIGLFFAIGRGLVAMGTGTHPFWFSTGITGLILMTVAGGVLGFIGGVIVAAIYNNLLGAAGGIEMDLESKV